MRIIVIASTTLAFLVSTIGLQAAEIPRPEHPQPQFVRSNWQTLNGEWQFKFDDQNRGIGESWSDGKHSLERKILVPYCFESKLSGITDTGFHPIVWYQRKLDIPANWNDKHTLLHFGAVDYRAQVWVNGHLAGVHEGGNVPFSFDITPLLEKADNVITVRAEDPPTDRSIPRGKQYWKPQSQGIFYTRTSGIWQPVWIESTGKDYLRYAHVTADASGTATISAQLDHPPDSELTFSTEILEGSTVVGKSEAKTSLDRADSEIKINNVKPWSPSNPFLYDVRFKVMRGAEQLDEVQSYIGFRTIAIKDNRVTINGQPIYLKFLLDQGYWPESILTPPSEAAIQRDIDIAVSMGFNGVRKHQKVEDPRFMYWADKRGFLVSGEIANSYEFNEPSARRLTQEWTEAIERDFNHPSIIIWNAINESWGVPKLSEPKQQTFLKSLYFLTRTLDPSRLMIDNEGWEHTDVTDLMAVHNYEKSGEKLYEDYKDVKPGMGAQEFPKSGRKDGMIPGFHYNGSPLYLSEFGGISYLPPGVTPPAGSWGYSGLERNQDAATSRLEQLFTGLAKMTQLVGMCYTQLTDVEQEVNGLVTYDRKLKFDAAKVKALNDRLH